MQHICQGPGCMDAARRPLRTRMCGKADPFGCKYFSAAFRKYSYGRLVKIQDGNPRILSFLI